MAQYKVQPGDSPTLIARAFGVPFDALIAANPHKRTTLVDGRRTWQSIVYGETVNLPVGGALGAVTVADPKAPHATIRQGSYGPDVALWQTILGVTVDGSFGPKTAAATKTWQGSHGLTADGIVGPKTWSAALGSLMATAPAITPNTSVPLAVQTLLAIDPCSQASDASVRAAQAALGVTVDGKYGTNTAAAARRLLPNAPAACSPRPAWWTPASAPAPVAPKTIPTTTQIPSTSAPAAVQALLSINPCLQTNSGIVYAAQVALGIKPDGKYGPGTSAAARALVPSAPAACSPTPLWWGVKGTAQATAATVAAKTAAAGATVPAASPVDQAKATAAAAAAQAADAAAKASQATTQAQADAAATAAQAAIDAAAKAAAQATTQAQANTAAAATKTAQAAADAAAAKGGTAITAPEKKPISTGAIVAGAIGAVALVGVIAAASMGGKGKTGRRGARGRGPTTHRKPAHKGKSRKSRKPARRR